MLGGMLGRNRHGNYLQTVILPSSTPSMLQLSYSSFLRTGPLPSKSPETPWWPSTVTVGVVGVLPPTYITDGQAHEVQVHVPGFRQLSYGRPEEHALVVRMGGDQQHPVRFVVVQVQHLGRASRRPQTGPDVTDDQHRCRHKHGRVQVDGVGNVLMERFVQHRSNGGARRSAERRYDGRWRRANDGGKRKKKADNRGVRAEYIKTSVKLLDYIHIRNF